MLLLSYKGLKNIGIVNLETVQDALGKEAEAIGYWPAAGFPEEANLVRWLATHMSPGQRVQTSSSCCSAVPAWCHPVNALVAFPPCCLDFYSAACSWPESRVDVFGRWLLVNSTSDEWQQGKETNQRHLSGLTAFKSSASGFVFVAFNTRRIGIKYQLWNRFEVGGFPALALLQCGEGLSEYRDVYI